MFFEHFLAHRGVGFWTPVFDRSQRFRFIVRYEKGIDAHDDDDWRTKRLLLLFLSCFTKFDPILSLETKPIRLCVVLLLDDHQRKYYIANTTTTVVATQNKKRSDAPRLFCFFFCFFFREDEEEFCVSLSMM
tara:strand:- start:47 stop:442 length:396 start_codon:yes stop_codon:yes gene_type:complete